MKIYLDWLEYKCYWILPTIQFVVNNDSYNLYILFLKLCIDFEFKIKK